MHLFKENGNEWMLVAKQHFLISDHNLDRMSRLDSLIYTYVPIMEMGKCRQNFLAFLNSLSVKDQ